MRLPRTAIARPSVSWAALIAIGVAAPPAALHAALASAAGMLFEAAPFVLAAEVLPRRLAGLVANAGCGCRPNGRAGAPTLVATALCWFAFGPWIALGRLATRVALLRRRRAHHIARVGPRSVASDPFAVLGALIVPTFLASLAAQALDAHASALQSAWQPLVAVLGVALGAIVPCETAGIAIAAALAHPLPAAAGGMLLSVGLVGIRPWFDGAIRSPADRGAAFASLTLGCALAAIAWRGPAGLVNPRLLPFEAVGAALAVAGSRHRRTAWSGAGWIGAGLSCALAGGFAVPAGIASETTLAAAYPGQHIEFTGAAYRTGTVTTVQRFAITCCRLDAAPVAIRLTRRLDVTDGRWVALTGRVVLRDAALLVDPERLQRVAVPADPFVYR